MAIAMAALAKPVDRQLAARVANSFWSHTLGLKGNVQMVDRSADWPYSHLLLFTADGGGFVLMPTDDVARPVLAYSTTGTFDPQNLPAPLRPILEQYNSEIAAAQGAFAQSDPDWDRLLNGLPLKGNTKDGEADSVGPLVETQWYQMQPYNQLCPGGCMTGCVATAMSQVMRFWRYPAFGEGSHSYTSDGGYGVLSADFAHTVYDWDHMPVQASSSSSVVERTAVATLMYHVGVSVQMSYSPMQSGAAAGAYDGDTASYCAQNSFWRYFRYNRHSLQYLVKASTSDDDWTDMMIAELRHRRPIMYDGTSPAGGHSFICDGFDSRRYLHFNLGFGGSGDGFYAVGAINHGSYSFNNGNSAIIGIQPEYGLYVNETALSFNRAGGSRQVWLSTCDTIDAPWTAVSSASWLALADTSFSRLGQVTLTAEENTSGTERTATVTFRQAGREAVLSVTQAAFSEDDYCTLTVHTECTRTGTSWANGAHISFESPSGLVYGTVTHATTERHATSTVRVAPGPLVVRYHRGGAADRYYNYWVLSPQGDTLVAVSNAYYNGGDVSVENPCGGVGIEEAETAAPMLSVSPNPASASVTLSGLTPGHRVKVYDATGREWLSVESHGTATTLDVSHWLRGVYVVESTGCRRSKLVIE